MSTDSITPVDRVQRVLRLVVPAVALGMVVAIQRIYFNRGLIPGDSFTYLAAGERLNAGHLLYALSPGDRPVGFEPPFFTVPLLSPPPIAVLFRPLAAMPNEIGVYVWWIATILVLAAVILWMLRERPILVGLGVLLLSIPIVYQIGVGNLNGLIVAGIVVGWYLLTRRKDLAAGAVFALMTAFKVTPGIFLWWLITQRRWDAFKAFVVTGLVVLAVSVLGAGVQAHLEYLGIARQTAAAGTTYLSLAGAARYVGVPAEIANVLPTAAIVIGVAAVWLVRARPGAAYVAAIITLIAGSPVVQITWFTILLGVLAPIVWPMPSDARVVAGDSASRRDTSERSAGATSGA
jgi:glycosyl transferase family 87